LFLLSLISACKEPDSIGLGVQPSGDKLNVVYCDTTTLVAYTVKDDTIRTDETQYNLLGSNRDPVFGRNEASFYTQALLPSNAPNFGTSRVDSIMLSLAYSGTSSVYGDTNSLMTVKVYELAQSIYQDSTYYSNREFLTDNVPLAIKTFIPKPRDSVLVGKSKLAPQLRVRLDTSLGHRLINAGTTALSDNTNFPQFFKGIYVMASPATSAGAIISFDLLNPLSNITLYYHKSGDTTAYSYNFIMDGSTVARINHFNHTKYFYSDPYLRNELSGDTMKGNKVLYAQSMAGLKVRIRYPYLKNLTKNGRIAINKAVLIIPVDDSTYAPVSSLSTYAPPNQMVLLEEQNGLIRYLLDQYEGTSYYGGIYNSAKKEYRFNIARHVQQVVDGIKDNLGLYLVVWTANRPSTANRVVLRGPKCHTNNLRLDITYTKLY
jgi:hypothetical protein